MTDGVDMFDDITPDEVAQWLDRGASVVDVREPWEYQEGHVPGAVNIPVGDVPGRLSEIPDPVVVVCKGGTRSARIAEYLMTNGYASVANLVGGTERWIQEGNEVE